MPHGDKLLVGTEFDDLLRGAGGNDYIYGNGGNDILIGGPGDDVIYGGDGDDTIIDGTGIGFLHGGDGADTFVFGKDINSKILTLDVIYDLDFSEGDKLDLNGTIVTSDAELLALDGVDGFTIVQNIGINTVIHHKEWYVVLDDYII